MKELNVEQMETVQGGKFWGNETNCTNCIGVPGETGFRDCHSTYYVLWMKWSHKQYSSSCIV